MFIGGSSKLVVPRTYVLTDIAAVDPVLEALAYVAFDLTSMLDRKI